VISTGRIRRLVSLLYTDQFLGFCDSRHDVRFITGSMLRHPGSFLILGLVYPKKRVVAEGDALF
jgi:hypothetical protein